MASSHNAHAACVAIKTYTACNAGYYLQTLTDSCLSCPDSGVSADDNTGGITDCYLPSGTTGSDTTGTYEYTNDCYYSE